MILSLTPIGSNFHAAWLISTATTLPSGPRSDRVRSIRQGPHPLQWWPHYHTTQPPYAFTLAEICGAVRATRLRAWWKDGHSRFNGFYFFVWLRNATCEQPQYRGQYCYWHTSLNSTYFAPIKEGCPPQSTSLHTSWMFFDKYEIIT